MSCSTFIKYPNLLSCFVFIYRYVDVRCYGNITNLYKWFGKEVDCVYFKNKNIWIFISWPRGPGRLFKPENIYFHVLGDLL